MPRPGDRRRWPSIVVGYLVLAVVVAIPTTVMYRFVEATHRPAVLRAAAGLVLGVLLLHVRAVARASLDAQLPSTFGVAPAPSPSTPLMDRLSPQLQDEVRFSASSERYFEHALWPRLRALHQRLGADEPLVKPRGRPWLGRGPSLRSLGELVTTLERTGRRLR